MSHIILKLFKFIKKCNLFNTIVNSKSYDCFDYMIIISGLGHLDVNTQIQYINI